MAKWIPLLLLVGSLQESPTSAPTLRDLVGTDFTVRITAVSDGDTVDVLPEGDKRSIRVRLEGIDTPERGEAFNQNARAFTRVLLFNKTARARGMAVDRYGRLVARLYVAATDASVELLKVGLACHNRAYSSDLSLAKTEADARNTGRGFWARGAAKPRCALGNEPNESKAVVRSNLLEKPSSFHGNTDTHLYHAPWCRNFNCRKCTQVFATEAYARTAGFRPAADCFRSK